MARASVELSSLRQSRASMEYEDDVELKVSFKDLDGACEELIEYEVGSFVSAMPSSGSRAQFQRKSGWCTRCRRLLSSATARPEEVVTIMRGYFWKFNTGVELSSESLGKLANWRRRIFCLQRKSATTVITYLSEKENGVLQLACVVQGAHFHICPWRQTCRVSRLPEPGVELEVPESSREELYDSMRQYDVAFAGKAMSSSYASLIPERLQVLYFRQLQDAMEPSLILGARPELMRVWEGVLQEAVPSLHIDLDMPGGLKASAREA